MLMTNKVLFFIILIESSLIHSFILEKRRINNLESLIDEYRERVVKEHNQYRKKHCVSSLKLNDQITRSAQSYAEHLAKIDQLEHTDGSNGYGENLYWYSSSKSLNNFQKVNATSSWYDEIQDYDYSHPDFSMSTGHFTQVIWKGTQQLGVGIALTSDGKSVYVVAQYSPPGNFLGEFQENVLRPNC